MERESRVAEMNSEQARRFDPPSKLALHPQFAEYISGRMVYPINVEISPSGLCQAGCGFCLVGDTLIDTPNGMIPISQIKKGDNVYAPDGSVCKVTTIGSRWVDTTFVVRCGGRTIRATGEHPFLTADGWKTVTELSISDCAVVRMRLRGPSHQVSREVEQIFERSSVQRRQEPYEEKVGSGEERESPKREYAGGNTGKNFGANEIQQSDEKPRDGEKIWGSDEGEDQIGGVHTLDEYSRGKIHHRIDCQSEDVRTGQPYERSGDGQEEPRKIHGNQNLSIREKLCSLGGESRTTTGTYRRGSDLGSQTESRFQGIRTEKGNRAFTIGNIHTSQRQDRENPGELCNSFNRPLQQETLAVSSSISRSFTGHNTESERDHRRLLIAGIQLERGLALRPIDSNTTVIERVQVFNFACERLESYEANGFVVHNCPFANTGELGHHRNVMLDSGRALLLLTECSQLGVKSISWTGGGEPSLHPDFHILVEEAHSVGLEQGIFTNALAKPKYKPERMTWIRITMTDRPYAEEYIKELRAAKTLGFAFNYTGPQDDEYLRETCRVAERVGADYVQIRPALKFHGETVDIKPPAIDHPLAYVTDYKFEQAKVKHDYKTCEAYHLIPFIWEDGNVDVCAYMRKHEGYTLGNIYANKLKHILDFSPRDVPVDGACQVCCRNHEHNRSIHAARELKDVNFP